jgi:hypothetical protein
VVRAHACLESTVITFEMTRTVRCLPLPIAVLLASAGASAARASEAAWVARVNGTPTVQRGGTSAPLQRGDTLQRGDVIDTDERSKVKILFADDSVLDVGPRSHLSVDEFVLDADNRSVRLQVLVGRFKIAIAKFFGAHSDYEIRTATAVAGVRGTVLWGDTDLDTICALEGTITVRSLKTSRTPARVAAGHCVGQMSAGRTTPLKPSAHDLAAYLKEVTLE